MLVKLTQSLTLGVPAEESWKFLRATEQLAALIPGVDSVTRLPADSRTAERYAVQIVEKVGPFKLKLNLEVAVVEAIEPERLRAELSGGDSGAGNRVSGALTAELSPLDASHTRLLFDTSVEVLGRLASLGAVPIRRRSSELFSQFAERVGQKFPVAATQSS